MPQSPSSTPPSPRRDPYAAFRYPGYRLYALGWLAVVIGSQVESVALQWEIYQRTGQALSLGIIGLVQIVPALVLLLPAGHLADAFDRRRVTAIGMLGTTVTSLGLAVASIQTAPVGVLYGLLFFDAVFLTLARPARTAMLPLIVPDTVFSNAVTWNSSLMHLAIMLGPALGGLIVGFHAPSAYLLAAATSLFFGLSLNLIPIRQRQHPRQPLSLRSLLGGFHFVWHTRLVLAAIALDMFAVLLGGAVYMLPIYASDILQVDAWGFGLLRAAPAVGALLTAVAIAHLPPMRRAGRTLILTVIGFGIATILFGLSQSLWFALLMLFLTGVFDNISVVIRHTLVQLATPDAMRGRVSAVSSMFVGISNELGGFESGVVAHWAGPVFSVVSGGVGTVVVAVVTAMRTPSLRRLGRLDSVRPAGDALASDGTAPAGR